MWRATPRKRPVSRRWPAPLRRILALRQIGAETVLALIRAPQSSAEAYLAMVEENEIRAGVSFYERARVSAEAARLGLFPSPQAAIAALFPQASPAKRSKIGSFVALHQALGAALRFPAAIPERLGLALVQGLAEDGFATRAAEALTAASPETAAVERQVLEGLLAPARAPKPAAKPTPEELRPGLSLQRRGGRLELSGAAVTPELERDLAAWLAAYMDGRPPEA
jgi:ParB family chromosome partitioning protein